MDVDDLDRLWERNPAWRLLRARNAPLILSFLGRYFVEENNGAAPASALIGALDDELYAIHQSTPERFPAEPDSYLNEWSDAQSGWLRRFYPHGSDEVHFDATPALEKAYRWVGSLVARPFVGTESRLQTLVGLLQQIVHGSETDPVERIAELERRRDAIEQELEEAREGRFAVLGPTAIRERYVQFTGSARELLSDFREVEENFRALDRAAREKIASWEGGKGLLLEQLVDGRADITSSDEGQSFQAFSDFLLSEVRQDELTLLLDAVQAMAEVGADPGVGMIHHDWADAAERTQRTVRALSEQLRRFLEEQAWLENRRVLDLVRSIESAALAVRNDPPRGADVGLVIDEPGLPIALPFERPLYDPQPDAAVDSMLAPEDLVDLELEALFAQRSVDTARLAETIRSSISPRTSALLADVLAIHPVQEGVAELLGYMALSGFDDIAIEFDDGRSEVAFVDSSGRQRTARIPRVRITRS